MKELKDANEIMAHYNFLFSNAQGEAVAAQLSGMYWYKKAHPEMSAHVGVYLSEAMVQSSGYVPVNIKVAKEIDLELHFLVDEPKFIRVEKLPLGPIPYTIDRDWETPT